MQLGIFFAPDQVRAKKERATSSGLPLLPKYINLTNYYEPVIVTVQTYKYKN